MASLASNCFPRDQRTILPHNQYESRKIWILLHSCLHMHQMACKLSLHTNYRDVFSSFWMLVLKLSFTAEKKKIMSKERLPSRCIYHAVWFTFFCSLSKMKTWLQTIFVIARTSWPISKHQFWHWHVSVFAVISQIIGRESNLTKKIKLKPKLLIFEDSNNGFDCPFSANKYWRMRFFMQNNEFFKRFHTTTILEEASPAL